MHCSLYFCKVGASFLEIVFTGKGVSSQISSLYPTPHFQKFHGNNKDLVANRKIYNTHRAIVIEMVNGMLCTP